MLSENFKHERYRYEYANNSTWHINEPLLIYLRLRSVINITSRLKAGQISIKTCSPFESVKW